MKKGILISSFVVLGLALGCGGDNEDDNDPTPQAIDCSQLADPLSQEACQSYPRMLDMQVGLMQGVCSPNPDVCHQTNNYPDMHTAGNLLGLVGAPCNVELPDPTQGWDSCELLPDRIQSASHSTDIAYIEQMAQATWRIGLRNAAPANNAVPYQVLDSQGSIVFDANIGQGSLIVTFTAGSSEAILSTLTPEDEFLSDYMDSVLATVVGGNPNRNAVWGAVDGVEAGAVVWAGNLDKSYLWGRITGKVPGSRMPLANGPVTNPQYIALACWIEGLDPDFTQNSAVDVIQYDECSFAQAPEDLEITDF